jgi:hypothetical protein
MDTRNKTAIRLDALKRLVLNNTLSGTLPLYIVTEYPKSGGTWLAQLLSYYLEVPFPRNQMPKLESSVMHGHLLRTPFMKNVFCLFRDGRDIVVSYYYHTLFKSDKNTDHLVNRTRAACKFENYDDIQANLPEFIRYLFEEEKQGMFHFNWNEFAHSWLDQKKVAYIKYEDMLEDSAAALKEPIEKITGKPVNMERLIEARDKFSFKNQTQRNAGEEDKKSFLRKGISGDWKNHFTKEACEAFNKYAGETLIKLGYEKDNSWIANQTENLQK